MNENQINQRSIEIREMMLSISKNTPERTAIEQNLMMERNNMIHVFGLCKLLEMSHSNPDEQSIAFFAAIELKNTIKNNYSVWMTNSNTPLVGLLNDLKQRIFGIYLQINHANLSKCTFECIQIFLDFNYFPECWPDFLNLCEVSLKQENHLTNLKIFKALKHLSTKYSNEERSDELYLEIIEVVLKTHDTILQMITNYIDAVVQSKIDSLLGIKILKILFKIFYNYIFQDIHPKIESNISVWVNVLKQILNENFQNIILNSTQNSQKGLFSLKGECIKIILLINNKYKEDFEEYLDNFTQEIWNNCLRKNNTGSDKLIKYSIKYFKSFASNEKYEKLFGDNMKELIINLIIPAFTFDENDWEIFENETDLYSENLFFLSSRGINSEREAVQDFVQTLGKFHTQSFFVTMNEIINQLVEGGGDLEPMNSLLLLNILINGATHSSNIREGIMAITCPKEFIEYVFDNIVLRLLQSQCSGTSDQINMNNLFILSQIIRFLNMFKYFISVDKTLQTFQLLISKNYHLNMNINGVMTYQQALFTFGNNLLNLKNFTYENELEKNQTGMNFYEKHYIHPQKLSIKIERKIFYIQNNNSLLGTLVEHLYTFFLNNENNVKESALLLFKNCLLRLETNILEFVAPLLKIYKQFIVKIEENKIPLNFGIINEIFESFSSLIISSSSNNQNLNGIMEIIELLPKLFLKNVVEMHSLILQVFSVIITSYKINIYPDLPLENTSANIFDQESSKIFKQNNLVNVISSCMDINNYKNELLALSDVYLRLLISSIKHSPSIIQSEWPQISKILTHLVENKMHLSVISFFKDLLIININNQNLFSFLFDYIQMMIGTNFDSSNLILQTLFFREITIYFMLFCDINGVDNLFSLCNKLNKIGILQGFFNHKEFYEFCSKFGGSQERKYVILMFSKFLCEQTQMTLQALSPEIFRVVLNTLLENEYLRIHNYKKLSMARKLNMNYQKTMNQQTKNAFGSVYFMRCSEAVNKVHIKKFLTDTAQIESGKLFLNKIRENLQMGTINQSFIDSKYYQML